MKLLLKYFRWSVCIFSNEIKFVFTALDSLLKDDNSDEYEVNAVTSEHWGDEDTERDDPDTSDSCSTCYEPVAENSARRPESATEKQSDEHTDEDSAQLHETSMEQAERAPIEQREEEHTEDEQQQQHQQQGDVIEEETPEEENIEKEHIEDEQQQQYQQQDDVVEETPEKENISSSESKNDGDDSRIADHVAGGRLTRTLLMTYLEPSLEVTQEISMVAQADASQDPGYLGETDEPEPSTSTNRRQSRAVTMHDFYTRRETERDRSYHRVIDRTRMTYHRFDTNRLLDR